MYNREALLGSWYTGKAQLFLAKYRLYDRISYLSFQASPAGTPNYTKILNAMRTEPTLTLSDMKGITGISIAAIQKLLDQLIQKKIR